MKSNSHGGLLSGNGLAILGRGIVSREKGRLQGESEEKFGREGKGK